MTDEEEDKERSREALADVIFWVFASVIAVFGMLFLLVAIVHVGVDSKTVTKSDPIPFDDLLEPARPPVPEEAPEPHPWDIHPPGWSEAQHQPDTYQEWLQGRIDGHLYRVWAKITAYCPCTECCGTGSPGKTATQSDASKPGIAIASQLMRAYREEGVGVHIPGYLSLSHTAESWVPDDTGGAMNRSFEKGVFHIDVRYQNHEWARTHWGTRHGWVYLVSYREE